MLTCLQLFVSKVLLPLSESNKHYSKTPSDENNYRRYKKIYSKLIRDREKQYYSELFNVLKIFGLKLIHYAALKIKTKNTTILIH